LLKPGLESSVIPPKDFGIFVGPQVVSEPIFIIDLESDLRYEGVYVG
jgi:hypothetical protein